MTTGEQFYRGKIIRPDGLGERVVLQKGTRALAERIAIKEAERNNWDWIVQHCRIEGIDHDQRVVIVQQWSSLAGHEEIETQSVVTTNA